MGFFVLGVNHKACPLEIREKLHFRKTQAEALLDDVKQRPGISELMILSTCNRVELYGYADGSRMPEDRLIAAIEKLHGISRSEFEPYLYRYENKEAVRQLIKVTAGLDSLVVGENEILGQVREAFRLANAAGSVHSLLYRLTERALKTGKEIRHVTKINEGAVSIASVAVELAEKIFGKLTGEKVMVLGTGEMGALTLKSLKSAGAEIHAVVSRSAETGVPVADAFGALWVSMQDWEKELADVDILIASTSAPHTVVTSEQIRKVMQPRRRRPLFLIDIAVPRDIDAEVNMIDDVYLYNIDDLKGFADANLKLRRKEIRQAEQIVDRAVEDFQSWMEQLKARPTMERFEKFLDEVLENELTHFSKEINLTEDQKSSFQKRVRAKLLHPPHEKIKEASQNGGVARYLEALQSLFKL